ncbi:type II toxin-antitoxin system RelE/ParE family toxin [Vibrio quintilis]|nr:type II toxin-antitoxin system RelE/ParE family toxin [Vibrio quintilis]
MMKLLLAPVAQSDLKHIWQFGVDNWGVTKSNQYIDAIKSAFLTLMKQPSIGLERPGLLQDLRSHSVKSHTIFYRVLTDRVEIIRILHNRQDPGLHL